MAKEHKIRINGDQAQKEIKGLTDQIKKLKKVIEVSNQGSEKQKRAMRKLSSAVKKAKKDIQQYGSAVDKTTKLNGKYRLSTKGLQRSVGILRNKLLLVTFALGGVGAAVKKVISAHGEQEQAERLLASRLGHVNKELLAQASAIQKVTIHGDEANIRLMTLGANLGINEDNLGKATEAAIGLSTAYGLDLNMSMRAIAMAQKGNTDMLARYIPALRTTKDETEKLAIVNKAAEEGYKQAKEQAKTMTGSVDQMKNAVGDTAEAVGKLLAPAVIKIARNFTSAASSVSEYITQLQLSNTSLKGVVTTEDRIAVIVAKIAKARKSINDLRSMGSLDALTEEKLTERIALLNKQLALTKMGNFWEFTKEEKKELKRLQVLIDKIAEEKAVVEKAAEERKKAAEEQLKLDEKIQQKLADKTKNLIQQRAELEGLTTLQKLELKYGKEWVDKHPKLVKSYIKEKEALEGLKKAKEDANTASERENQLLDDQIKRLELAAIKTAGMRIETEEGGDASVDVADAVGRAFTNTSQLFASMAGEDKDRQIRAMRLAQAGAVASTAGGVAKAFEQTGVYGFLSGVAIAAAGAAQVATIQNAISDAQGFAQGGIVPGQGTGDTVPAMLTPGEVILNQAQQENLVGGMGGGITINIQGGIIQEDYVRNELIPAINKATSLGARINA